MNNFEKQKNIQKQKEKQKIIQKEQEEKKKKEKQQKDKILQSKKNQIEEKQDQETKTNQQNETKKQFAQILKRSSTSTMSTTSINSPFAVKNNNNINNKISSSSIKWSDKINKTQSKKLLDIATRENLLKREIEQEIERKDGNFQDTQYKISNLEKLQKRKEKKNITN